MPPENLPETKASQAETLWQRRLDLEEDLGLRSGHELDFRNWRMKLFAASATFATRCAGLYPRGRRNTRDFEFGDVHYQMEQLPPALDGLQILHLSDFHLSKFDPEFAEAVIELVRGAEADLCFMTGDFRYGYYGTCEHIYPVIQRILQALKLTHGAYGILGNHDLSTMVEPLEGAGLRMLVNRGALLQIADTPVWIGGVDDAHRFHAASVPDALRGAPAGSFKVLLAHTPENVVEAAESGFDFCLCGHTHGGQIAFPWIGPLLMNARCPATYHAGKWRCGRMHGYTTRGLGTTDVPLRFNCRPEATMITLHQAQSP